MSRLSFCAPSSLRIHLSRLLTQGACLTFPGPDMPVPIPINECVVLTDHRVLWATCHTPFGPVRPCVGSLTFHRWETTPSGSCTFHNDNGSIMAAIIPTEQLGLPGRHASRLLREQSDHRLRASQDPTYASRWARQFREARATISTDP